MSQDVALNKRAMDVQDLMTQNAAQFSKLLPAVVSPHTFIATAIATMQDNPDLLTCTVSSLVKSLLFCAQLGLVPGARGHVYLIPFKNHGIKEVQVIPSYQGLLVLARRSKQIARINASVVLNGDFFQWKAEPPDVVHEQNSSFWGSGGKDFDANISGAYAVAVLTNSSKHVTYWPVARIRAHRDRFSQAKTSGPWVEFFPQMSMKTVLRELCTLLPTEDTEATMGRAINIDKAAEVGMGQQFDFAVPFLTDAPTAAPTSQTAERLPDVPAKAQPEAQIAGAPVLPFAPRGREHCVGKTLDDPTVTKDDLKYYETFFEKSSENPARASYRMQDLEMFSKVQAELKRRG